MKHVITIQQIYRIFKWTIIFVGINLVLAYRLRFLGPIKCASSKLANLTSLQADEKCLERESIGNRGDKVHKSEELLQYEYNYNEYHLFLFKLVILFIFISFHWHTRKKIRRNQFEPNLTCQTNEPKEYDEQNLVNDNKQIIETFKKAVRNKEVEISFVWSVVHVFSAVFVVLMTCYEVFFYQSYSIIVGIEEICPSFKSLFQDEAICEIKYLKEDTLEVKHDDIYCKLFYNKFYRISQISVWYYFSIMIILTTISLMQFVILVHSKNSRLERLAKLLPQIDKTSLEPFANDRSSYFVIEETNRKLDKDQFQKLIKLLVKEEYRLDLALKNITNV